MLRKITMFFKSLFSRKPAQPAPPAIPPKAQAPAPEKAPAPAPKPENQAPKGPVDWMDWTRRAMLVSGAFEGKGEDWGNPVGNFDGAYLTCGLLGYTWKWNNQPPMILEFLNRHGETRARQLMPTVWSIYLKAARAGQHNGAGIVASWTSSTNKSVVSEPYRSELRAFWSSPEMRVIQTEKAWDMMGKFAMNQTLKGQQFYGLKEPHFSHFAYWFDQAVLNGTGKTPAFKWVTDKDVARVFSWIASESGYNERDAKQRNLPLWREQIKKATPVQKALFFMAMERAEAAREEFDLTVMNRRGTLALGLGWVNGTLRQYAWKE